jgi:hypothetical protein
MHDRLQCPNPRPDLDTASMHVAERTTIHAARSRSSACMSGRVTTAHNDRIGDAAAVVPDTFGRT